MGGIGSGRRYRTDEVKKIVESSICLDYTYLKKEGDMKNGQCFEIKYSEGPHEIMTLNIFVNEEFMSLEYKFEGRHKIQNIDIAIIPCFGSHTRQYLICPACGAHRNQLYLGSGGIFSCRLCLRLGYRVQRLNKYMRHTFAADKLWREKFKLQENTPKNIFHKPKYMREKTYNKVVEQIIWHEQKSHKAFMEYFNTIKGAFDAKVSEPNVLTTT